MITSNVDALLEQELDLLDLLDAGDIGLDVLLGLQRVQEQIRDAEWHAARAGSLAARRAARSLASPIAQAN